MNCGRKGNKNIKGKMKYIISVLSIILVVANSSNVFAAETSAGVSAEQIISIDAGKPTLETGKTLEEVLGIQNARATSMPNQTWDWSKGKLGILKFHMNIPIRNIIFQDIPNIMLIPRQNVTNGRQQVTIIRYI